MRPCLSSSAPCRAILGARSRHDSGTRAAIRPFSPPPCASSLAAMEQKSRNASSLSNISAKIVWADSISWSPAVPALHVLGVRAQVRTGFEEPVVKVEVQVMSLDVVHDEHRRHRARELAERVEDVLCLRRDAGLERRVVDLGAAPDAGTVGPGARRPGVERA